MLLTFSADMAYQHVGLKGQPSAPYPTVTQGFLMFSMPAVMQMQLMLTKRSCSTLRGQCQRIPALAGMAGTSSGYQWPAPAHGRPLQAPARCVQLLQHADRCPLCSILQQHSCDKSMRQLPGHWHSDSANGCRQRQQLQQLWCTITLCSITRCWTVNIRPPQQQAVLIMQTVPVLLGMQAWRSQ